MRFRCIVSRSFAGVALAASTMVVGSFFPALAAVAAAAPAPSTAASPSPMAAPAAGADSSHNRAPGTTGMALRAGSAALNSPKAPTTAPTNTAPNSPKAPTNAPNAPAATATSGTSNQQSPAANPASDLVQGSGPVMTNPVIYNVFWLPAGQHYESDNLATSDTRYENLLNRFAQDVGGNDFYNIVTQYSGSNGTPANAVTFGGSWVDTAAYPHAGTQADPLLDVDIQNEATNAATTNGWTSDINHIYLVYTGLNVFECQSSTADCNFFKTGHTNAYCAYHFFFGGSPTVYAFMGSDGMGGCSNGLAPNGDATADAETSTASHEFIEAVTDPKIDNWLSSVATGQQEIGDLCNRSDGPTNTLAPGADVYLNGNPYEVQMEWSNAVHGCATDLNAARNGIVPPTLTINKSAPTNVVTGQPINYSITVANPSNTDASTLTTVTDTLPAGVSYVAGSASPGPTSTSPLTWNLATIAVHDSITLTFQAKSNPQAISNCAGVGYADQLQINTTLTGGPACAATTIAKAQTTTAVTSDHNPSVFGQPVTLTATVSVNAPGAGTPTGTVQFFDGATPIGSGSLTAGQFAITTAALSVATHPITATYAGDANFLGSTSGVLNQVVNKAPTLTTLTASSPGSVGFGHPVTFTATVSVPPPGAGNPTGPVIFSVDGTAVQTVNLNASEHATVTTSALSPGSHLIAAAYQGDGNFLPSTGTLTYLVTCTVTITGNYPSALIASGDSTCVVNATVGGSITVPKATSLAVVNSAVHGSINATNKANAIEICGSHVVGGSVDIVNAQGLVIVGDPGDANCAVNTISGTLLLRTNTHGLEAIGNTVGALVVSGNSGPGPYPGDVTTIAGNIISH
ncbi:MAG: hypothetical protein QOJ52_2242 [Acidimicrobiaceae bacterium]|nr:hypothetical protein [Acidimicrobiaceae bacterium]